MPPKKMNTIGRSVVEKRNSISVETKTEIISKHENGVWVSFFTKEYDKAEWIICNILKNKDALQKADISKEVTILHMLLPQRLLNFYYLGLI